MHRHSIHHRILLNDRYFSLYFFLLPHTIYISYSTLRVYRRGAEGWARSLREGVVKGHVVEHGLGHLLELLGEGQCDGGPQLLPDGLVVVVHHLAQQVSSRAPVHVDELEDGLLGDDVKVEAVDAQEVPLRLVLDEVPRHPERGDGVVHPDGGLAGAVDGDEQHAALHGVVALDVQQRRQQLRRQLEAVAVARGPHVLHDGLGDALHLGVAEGHVDGEGPVAALVEVELLHVEGVQALHAQLGVAGSQVGDGPLQRALETVVELGSGPLAGAPGRGYLAGAEGEPRRHRDEEQGGAEGWEGRHPRAGASD